jgi:septum formation protein
MQLILASKSPRRREILSSLGLKFSIFSPECDESSSIDDPRLLVKTLAERKGIAARDLLLLRGELTPNTLIIASDTVVSYHGGILGKPQDKEDATCMLKALSAKTSEVHSGIALLYNGKMLSSTESTVVHFAEIPPEDIRRYVDSGEPMDKAGAYAIQGLASQWITGIDGDYFNVVGFPIHRFAVLLKELTGHSVFDLAGE